MKSDPTRSAVPTAPSKQRRRRFVLGGALALALAASAVPAVDAQAGLSRDAERMRSLQHIDAALRAYHQEKGQLPSHVPDSFAGGWETSTDGQFLEELVVTGYLDHPVLDPLNDGDHHLRYACYPAGTEGAEQPFYVLAVTALESDQVPFAVEARQGDRDWAEEYPLALLGP
ncbi:MAG: hypothetical protein P1V81_08125 [Planctomycetota bacterium]|nr:hypothetical protein [Planctomycetota bacterium]